MCTVIRRVATQRCTVLAQPVQIFRFVMKADMAGATHIPFESTYVYLGHSTFPPRSPQCAVAHTTRKTVFGAVNAWQPKRCSASVAMRLGSKTRDAVSRQHILSACLPHSAPEMPRSACSNAGTGGVLILVS